jgi:predicted transcriptional regulator
MSLADVQVMVERLSDSDRLALLTWLEQREALAEEVPPTLRGEELSAAIRLGLAQLERGETVSGDEAHERMSRKAGLLHQLS